jgi:FdhD protein
VLSETSRPFEVTRVGPATETTAHDRAATEEPLEVRLGALTFATIMRTPGADRELTAGFLLSEQLITEPADVASLRHCTDGEGAALGNVMNAWLVGAAAERAAERVADRRLVTASSSCGLCGRRSVEDLMALVPRLAIVWSVTRHVISSLPERLRASQAAFDDTGGIHAAGLFDRDGTLLASAEDVGRHNAVDKVIGAQFLAGALPLGERILFVSGRTSFEIVQKAVVAGIPFVASVSAPSSLAIDLAREANLTLVGFVRGDTFNIYSAAERIQ